MIGVLIPMAGTGMMQDDEARRKSMTAPFEAMEKAIQTRRLLGGTRPKSPTQQKGDEGPLSGD